MESLLHTLFYFIVAIGILVAFHEYGHFLLARKLGVKVLRFSIGFGRIIWSYQKNPQATEFVLSAVPLGGYVKMVDEREGPVAKEDLPYAFNRQPLLSRTAIVLAGPVFNLFLAIVLYWCVFMIGETGIRPIVGSVSAGTLAAKAGFENGEEIIAVNDKITPTWTEAMGAVFASALTDSGNVDIEVQTPDEIKIHRTLTFSEQETLEPEEFYKRLGLRMWIPEFLPVIDKVLPDESAAKAGLQEGDLITRADDQSIESWTQWVDYVRSRADSNIVMTIERDGVQMELQIIPASQETEQGTVGRIGASVKVPEEILAYMQVEYSLTPIAALSAAIDRTWFYSITTLKMMGYMLVGKASVENLSGPISIAQYAGQSASMGLVHFLKFLAIVSVSLGVLNLLPIPVLDGGHLLLYAIEAVKGSPVSEKSQIVFQNIGMLLLFSLMGLAVFIDLGRVIG